MANYKVPDEQEIEQAFAGANYYLTPQRRETIKAHVITVLATFIASGIIYVARTDAQIVKPADATPAAVVKKAAAPKS